LSAIAARFPLGHAAFYGLGAYASALASIHWQVPFLLAYDCRTVSAFFGFGLGMPHAQGQGRLFGIVTLGFGVIIDLVLLNLDITGRSGTVWPGYPHLQFWGN